MTALMLAFAVIFACGAVFGVSMWVLLLEEDHTPYDEDHAAEMEALGRATRRQ